MPEPEPPERPAPKRYPGPKWVYRNSGGAEYAEPICERCWGMIRREGLWLLLASFVNNPPRGESELRCLRCDTVVWRPPRRPPTRGAR